MTIMATPNNRAGVDAGRPLLFAFGHPRPGTTHHGRYGSLTLDMYED
jgi:hypothetical protein